MPKTHWCHECKAWKATEVDHTPGGLGYVCLTCGEVILCDECGQEWTAGHECEKARR